MDASTFFYPPKTLPAEIWRTLRPLTSPYVTGTTACISTAQFAIENQQRTSAFRRLSTLLVGFLIRTVVLWFQKRGLPHAHILLILKNKIRPDDIDNIVSAEIPDKTICPLAYDTITKCMLHSPCGVSNPNAPRMKDGPCSKGYPRPFSFETTSTGKDGYPRCRRRRDVSFENSNGIDIDNTSPTTLAIDKV